jgi:hypothetical protein
MYTYIFQVMSFFSIFTCGTCSSHFIHYDLINLDFYLCCLQKRTAPREIGWEGVDWMHLAQDMAQWQDFVNMVMNLQVP